jgi:hypothetical protein
LVFEQERFIGRLQRHVQEESNIIACFLSGSFGRRLEDDYSDLDIALIYADEATREHGWQQRRELVRAIMPYVPARSFDADHVRPYFHVALYSNGTKADYRFEARELLQPSPWDRDIRIIKDSGRWAEEYQAASTRLASPQPYLSADELVALDNRFWVMSWDVLRLLLRGDANKPFTIYLELLHFTLPPLLRLLPAEEPARQGLLTASYSHDTAATAQQLARLLDAYLAARTAVVQRQRLLFVPDQAFENEMKRLIARLVGK